jgi:hypothetical protein
MVIQVARALASRVSVRRRSGGIWWSVPLGRGAWLIYVFYSGSVRDHERRADGRGFIG